MKKLAIVAALALAVSSTASASPWIKSFAQAQQKAKTKNQHIFVDLFADWCGWCHKFEQDVIPSQAFQQATDDMVLLRLNTEDQGDGTSFARRYSVTSLPTFLILDKDAIIVGIIRGYQVPNDFANSIKDVEGRYDGFMKRVAGEPSIAKDFQKRLELAKEFRIRYALPQAEDRFKKLTVEKGVPVAVRDESYYELALAQLLQKKYDDSMQTIQKFGTLQKTGENYEKSRLLMGDVYLQQGKIDRAVAEYRAFKTAFPQSQYVKNIDMMLPQLERQIPTAKK
ncbi:MAG TPA: thioredoxin family protein [Thermoanaerobaculia bacterium]|nr:thioredoxin family protein [Thermoanaerobaculia bacterium]